MDELRAVLELATDEELQDLTEILFRRKFNPLDYVNTPDLVDIQSQDRDAWIDTLERRFRFLAADGVTVLQRRTEQITYRQVLLQVCRYLKLPYAGSMSTTDLEAEIFLHLLSRAWERMTIPERKALTARVQKSLSTLQLAEQLPLPIRQDPVSLVIKGGSALAVSSVIQPLVLQLIARQFAIHFATYQVAKEAIVRGGAAAAVQFQNHVLMQSAGRSMAMSAARYGAVRSVFAFMVLRAGMVFCGFGLAIDRDKLRARHSHRFCLAQIRLTRAECFEAV